MNNYSYKKYYDGSLTRDSCKDILVIFGYAQTVFPKLEPTDEKLHDLYSKIDKLIASIDDTKPIRTIASYIGTAIYNMLNYYARSNANKKATKDAYISEHYVPDMPYAIGNVDIKKEITPETLAEAKKMNYIDNNDILSLKLFFFVKQSQITVSKKSLHKFYKYWRIHG